MSRPNYPREHAKRHPDKPAVIVAETGETLTYGELERRANKLAHGWRTLGLAPGDVIAVMLENTVDWFEIYWSAQRSGLYITPLPVRLTVEEAAYIIQDSGSKVLVTSAEIDASADLIARRAEIAPGLDVVFSVGAPLTGAKPLASLSNPMPDEPISDETAGFHLTYSSGTTGKPKGIKLPLGGGPPDADIPMVQIIQREIGRAHV